MIPVSQTRFVGAISDLHSCILRFEFIDHSCTSNFSFFAFQVSHNIKIEWMREFHPLIIVNQDVYTERDVGLLCKSLMHDSLLPPRTNPLDLKKTGISRGELSNSLRVSIVIGEIHVMLRLVRINTDLQTRDHLPTLGCVTFHGDMNSGKINHYLCLKPQDLTVLNKDLCYFT